MTEQDEMVTFLQNDKNNWKKRYTYCGQKNATSTGRQITAIIQDNLH